MNLAQPRLLWLLLLAPLAAAAAVTLLRARLRADEAWAARGLWDRLLPGFRRGRIALTAALLAVAVAATALALARPRWGATHEHVERHGVDVVFVLDTSLSMAATDVAPTRFEVARALLRRLVADLPGNRVALVEAEGEGVVMAPLTTDGGVIDLLLDTAAPGSLPTPGTVLGPALMEAARLFPEGDRKHRVIVLLSDGEDHAGGLDEVADKLAERGIAVDAIGIGTDAGGPIPLPGGTANEFKRDADGRVVITRLEASDLEPLVQRTGGVYLHSTGAGTDTAPLVARIAGMEKMRLSDDVVTTLEERFQWPLGLAALATVALLLLRPFAEDPR